MKKGKDERNKEIWKESLLHVRPFSQNTQTHTGEVQSIERLQEMEGAEEQKNKSKR